MTDRITSAVRQTLIAVSRELHTGLAGRGPSRMVCSTRPALIVSPILATGLAVLAAVTGCGNSTKVNVAGPSISKCGVSISGNSSPAPAAGGTGTLTVSTARECAWSARSESSWIALSSTEGQGPASLGYAILPNPNGTLRRGTVAVEDQRLEIAQEPAPCRYDVSPLSVDLGAGSGAIELNLVAPGGCGWTTRPSDTWLSAEPSSGAGATTVRLVVALNPGPARTGNVSIGDTTVAVRQAGNSTAPPPPAPPTPAPPRSTPAPAPPTPARHHLLRRPAAPTASFRSVEPWVRRPKTSLSRSVRRMVAPGPHPVVPNGLPCVPATLARETAR